jgi:hypothetical protein
VQYISTRPDPFLPSSTTELLLFSVHIPAFSCFCFFFIEEEDEEEVGERTRERRSIRIISTTQSAQHQILV